MKKAEVEIGQTYVAKVSGRLAPVKLIAVNRYGGWTGVNLWTGREVHVKSAARLRAVVRQPVMPQQPSTPTAE